ncbi:hypothetical protein [Halorussus halobius]|uniref:hypothetical protein n=1 Tax=Halorussus halobius TaxID=1710537 RepID=UPI001091BC63|nr:hypothetical protein [Halorussus halobius]
MLVERALALATTVVLAGTFPLALIAARGFRDAPFGSVLRPLPVVILAFVALNAPGALSVDSPDAVRLATSLVATVSALVSAAHAVVLLTERRKL